MACEPRRSTLWGLRLPALLSGWVLPDPGARTVGGTGSERGERWLRLQRRRTARAAGRSLKTDCGRSCCGSKSKGGGSRNLTLAARQLYPSSRRSPTIWRRAHQAAVWQLSSDRCRHRRIHHVDPLLTFAVPNSPPQRRRPMSMEPESVVGDYCKNLNVNSPPDSSTRTPGAAQIYRVCV